MDEYLERRLRSGEGSPGPAEGSARHDPSSRPDDPSAKAKAGSAGEREARKAIARIDKQLARLAERETALHAALAEASSDYAKLADLGAEPEKVLAEKDALEMEWLEASEILE